MSKLIDFSSLNEMLYGDPQYIKEFAEAAIISFTEFNTNYAKYLAARDEENYRRAGHKIKPVAQMLGLDQIITEYENGKKLIWDEKPDADLKKSIKKIDDISTQVVTELDNLSSS